MIYIFQGAQGLCSLPGYGCKACGEACKSCPGACRAVSEACGGCGDGFKHFMEKPLSAYVVVSAIISALTILSCQSDMQMPLGCTSNFLYLLSGFAAINMIFAVYVQCQVWRQIMSEENQAQFIDGDRPTELYAGKLHPAAAGLLAAAASKAGTKPPTGGAPMEKPAPNPGKIIVPASVVQSSFKKVFLEDFGVLLMFFLLLGVFFLSWQGQSYLDDIGGGSGNTCQASNLTRLCGYLFFWFAFLYTVAYMKCRCCANKVTIEKAEKVEYEGVAVA
jgi:hypothetical protein